MIHQTHLAVHYLTIDFTVWTISHNGDVVLRLSNPNYVSLESNFHKLKLLVII